MGKLPSARVLPTFANDRVSDYAGLFTPRHIELISDLSAEAFLAALRSFVSRKGKPTQIWSDNATCFHNFCKDQISRNPL